MILNLWCNPHIFPAMPLNCRFFSKDTLERAEDKVLGCRIPNLYSSDSINKTQRYQNQTSNLRNQDLLIFERELISVLERVFKILICSFVMTIEVHAQTPPLVGKGIASTKKEAEQLAATQVLAKLGEFFFSHSVVWVLTN